MEEERSPLWVHCTDCKCEWIICYTPAPIDTVTKAMTDAKCPECQSKNIGMGVRPKAVGISKAADPKDKVLAWLASGDCGVSSESLAFEFLGMERKSGGRVYICPPSDPADLGRCLRLIDLVPEVRKCVDSLAPKTYELMRDC